MHHIKFMFDYCADSCLWGMNGEGVLSLENFPISIELINTLEGLSVEYNSILNWDDPASGFVWTDHQIEEFRERAQKAYDHLCDQLGEAYTVENWINVSLGGTKT